MKPYPKDWEPIYLETEQTPDKAKEGYAQKRSMYGLSKEEFLNLAESQGYLCAICNASSYDAPYRLCVDHDHATNEIRGLLCSGCNYALGIVSDDSERLRKAADYLESKGTGVFVKETFSNTNS